MKRIRRIIISVVAATVGAIGVVYIFRTQSIDVRLDTYVKKHVELGYFSGSVLVAQGDTVLLSKGYGMADHEKGIQNSPQTMFHIASQTKMFTAVAILLLQEQGKLNICDAIAKYIPSIPNGDDITLHHLLTHTSGLPKITESDVARLADPISPEQLLKRIQGGEPVSDPGKQYEYNNYGYVLLTWVIERVSGQSSYGEFVRTAICEPLAMQHTTTYAEPVAGQYALDYRLRDVEEVPHLERHPTIMHPSQGLGAGELVSTAEDMYRFMRGLFIERRLLSEKSLAAMRAPCQTCYGYGLLVADLQGRKLVGHNGRINGFASYSVWYPEDGLCVVVLSNRSNTSTFFEMAIDCAAIVRGESYQMPSVPAAITLELSALDEYVGRYQGPDRSIFLEIVRKGDRLFQESLPFVPPSRIFLSAKDAFFSRVNPGCGTFKRNDTGVVDRLVIQGAEWKKTMD